MVILRNCEPRGFGKMCGMWIVLPLPISVAFGEGGGPVLFFSIHARVQESTVTGRAALKFHSVCHSRTQLGVSMFTLLVGVSVRRLLCQHWHCLCYPVQFPHRSQWATKIKRPLCFLWSPSVTAEAQKLFGGCCAVVFVFFSIRRGGVIVRRPRP